MRERPRDEGAGMGRDPASQPPKTDTRAGMRRPGRCARKKHANHPVPPFPVIRMYRQLSGRQKIADAYGSGREQTLGRIHAAADHPGPSISAFDFPNRPPPASALRREGSGLAVIPTCWPSRRPGGEDRPLFRGPSPRMRAPSRGRIDHHPSDVFSRMTRAVELYR